MVDSKKQDKGQEILHRGKTVVRYCFWGVKVAFGRPFKVKKGGVKKSCSFLKKIFQRLPDAFVSTTWEEREWVFLWKE